MRARDRNRLGRGLTPFTQKSLTLGPNDPRYRRQSQAGGTQFYAADPLYIEDGVLKIDLDDATQQVSGGKLGNKSGTIVPGAHATSHEAGGTDVIAHQQLSGAGTNAHAAIDTHIAAVNNPHAVTAAQVSPLTTKGDVWAYSTADGRFPVGSNRMLAEADSTASFGIKWAYKTYASVGTSAANYSVVASDEFILADTAAGNVTIDLPAVASSAGRLLTVIRPSAANVLTIDPSGAELVNGAGTFLVPTTAYLWAFLFCDGSAWYATT